MGRNDNQFLLLEVLRTEFRSISLSKRSLSKLILNLNEIYKVACSIEHENEQYKVSQLEKFKDSLLEAESLAKQGLFYQSIFAIQIPLSQILLDKDKFE